MIKRNKPILTYMNFRLHCLATKSTENRLKRVVKNRLKMCRNWFQPCENSCEKNFPKSAKIVKNRKRCGKLNITISVACNKLRRLGNLEVVTENPRVGSSILSLGTSFKKEAQHFAVLPFFSLILNNATEISRPCFYNRNAKQSCRLV
jgi:hypothetical protein